MKIKKNQAVVMVEVLPCGVDYETQGEELYFFGEEAKGLRRNQKKIQWWDGANWTEKLVRFDRIETFSEEPVPEFSQPPYTQFIEIDGREFSRSNVSRHLTPYYTEN